MVPWSSKRRIVRERTASHLWVGDGDHDDGVAHPSVRDERFAAVQNPVVPALLRVRANSLQVTEASDAKATVQSDAFSNEDTMCWRECPKHPLLQITDIPSFSTTVHQRYLCRGIDCLSP